MLKIKFYQIENLVAMKILEQSDEIERGAGRLYFDIGENFGIYSNNEPAIMSLSHFDSRKSNQLYIRGNEKIKDTKIAINSFYTIEEATDFIRKATKAVKDYNKILKAKTEATTNNNTEIKITIAE